MKRIRKSAKSLSSLNKSFLRSLPMNPLLRRTQESDMATRTTKKSYCCLPKKKKRRS